MINIYSSWVVFKCDGCVADYSYDPEKEKPPITENGACANCGSEKWVVLNADKQPILKGTEV